MAQINQHFLELQQSYLFSEVAKRVASFAENHPEKKIIRMGIGDVTLPLVPCVIEAMHHAVDEMAKKETFHGYGPEQGYDFLRTAIKNYYQDEMGVHLDLDEIFVSDGAKSDVGNITDLFSAYNTVLIPDPVYPVYVDTNRMLGIKLSTYRQMKTMDFAPCPLNRKADLIYLCSPNNPTGAAYSRQQLKAWVDYANRLRHHSVYDAAYEAFVSAQDLPRSIFEIEGAKTCAIEFCSLSKTAGFTGTRCGYTVVPKSSNAKMRTGKEVSSTTVAQTSNNKVQWSILYCTTRCSGGIYKRRQSGRQERISPIIGKMPGSLVLHSQKRESPTLVESILRISG